MDEVDEEMDEEERRAPTSRGRPDSIMWDMMLSGPPKLLERREKWMKTLQVTVDRKHHARHDAFRPTESFGEILILQ